MQQMSFVSLAGSADAGGTREVLCDEEDFPCIPPPSPCVVCRLQPPENNGAAVIPRVEDLEELRPAAEKTHERAIAWWFKACCFCYTGVGVHMAFSLGMLSCQCASYPWHVEALLLMAQGALSFLHDAYFVGLNPQAKIADRSCASFLTICQPLKFAFCSMDWLQLLVLVVFWSLGLGCFLFAKRAYERGQWQTYQVWHSLWHVALPLGGSLWIEYTRSIAPDGFPCVGDFLGNGNAAFMIA